MRPRSLSAVVGAAAWVMGLVAGMTAAAGATKEEIVREALAKQGKTAEESVLLDAARRCATITGIAVGNATGSPELRISGGAALPYTWFQIADGNRLVIDFHNAIQSNPGETLAPFVAPPIVRVRSSLFALAPTIVTRVVVDLSEAAIPRFSEEDGALVVRFASGNAGAATRLEQLSLEIDRQRRDLLARHAQLIETVMRSAAKLRDISSGLDGEALERQIAEKTAALTEQIDGAVNVLVSKIDNQHDRLELARSALEAGGAESDHGRRELDAIRAELKSLTKSDRAALSALDKEIRASCTREFREPPIQVARTAESKAFPTPGNTVSLAPSAPAAAGEPVRIDANAQAPRPKIEIVSAPPSEAVIAALDALDQELAALGGHTNRSDGADAGVSGARAVGGAPNPIAIQHDPPSIGTIQGLDALNQELAKLAEAETPSATNTDANLPAAGAASDGPAMEVIQVARLERLPEPLDMAPKAAGSPSAVLGETGTPQAEAAPTPVEAVAPEPVADADQSQENAEPIEVAAAQTAAPSAEPAQSEVETTEDMQAEAADTATPQPATEGDEPPPVAPAPSPEAPLAAEPRAGGAAEEAEAKPKDVIIAAPSPAARRPLPPGVDPMNQLVDIKFQEMELSNVVALLAEMAQVNVIAGTEVTGTVTADLRSIPLRQALDMVLRMNNLGIVVEEGIYRIVPYEDAVAARRTTEMIVLQNAQAEEVKATLDNLVVGQKGPTEFLTISANKGTNVIMLAGPEDEVAKFAELVRELDIKEPALPTVTEAIKLNYIEPATAQPIVSTMITEKIGKVEIDPEGRHVIATDLPVVVEQMRELLAKIDKPVKQVAIEAMVVDAVMRDASQTGINWMVDAIRRHSTNGDLVSDLSRLEFDSALGAIGTDALDAAVITVGTLSSEVRLQAIIAAEVQSRNAQILANPSIVTVENQTAKISIVQEFPFQEITQGLTGPPVATTEFKPIGVTLEVTPRITHDNATIVQVAAKQSSVSGLTETGVPIEDKREAESTLRVNDNRTIFIGGLRNISDRISVSKVPILGDVPLLNILFRNNDLEKVNTELLIFLTCRVIEEDHPPLTATQQFEYDRLDAAPEVPDAQRATFRSMVRPQEMRDPFWKWRRSNF